MHLLNGANAGVKDFALGIGLRGGLHQVALALHPGVKHGLPTDAAHLGGQRAQQPPLSRHKHRPQRRHVTQLPACKFNSKVNITFFAHGLWQTIVI